MIVPNVAPDPQFLNYGLLFMRSSSHSELLGNLSQAR